MAEDVRLVVDGADDALADRLVDSRWLNEREAPVFGRLDDRGRQWMFAAALEARGNPEEVLLLEAVRDFNGDDRGLAFGQRPGLVDDERVDLLHPFKRLGILDQHPGFGAAPHADHDRHRRCEAERAWAGDRKSAG